MAGNLPGVPRLWILPCITCPDSQKGPVPAVTGADAGHAGGNCRVPHTREYSVSAQPVRLPAFAAFLRMSAAFGPRWKLRRTGRQGVGQLFQENLQVQRLRKVRAGASSEG